MTSIGEVWLLLECPLQLGDGGKETLNLQPDHALHVVYAINMLAGAIIIMYRLAVCTSHAASPGCCMVYGTKLHARRKTGDFCFEGEVG
jgi:hypothetical protein